MIAWQLEPTDEFKKRFVWFEKKKKRELAAMMKHLKTYLTALEMGLKPQQINYKFVHPEPLGVIALDQGGGPLAQTRLYVYPYVEETTLVQLTIGDKKTQREDIQYCTHFVTEWLTTKSKEQISGEPESNEPAKDKNDESS